MAPPLTGKSLNLDGVLVEYGPGGSSPGRLHELIEDYHRNVVETVGRFDGFVAKIHG
jgi:hypothetical protein